MTTPSCSTQPQWNVVAAAHAGSSHESARLPCQDAAGGRVLDFGGKHPSALVAAVADGAGSASQSHIGAWLAVQQSISTLASLLSLMDQRDEPAALSEALRRTVSETHADLRARAEADGLSIGEFAATLLLAVQLDNTLGVAQVGDGAIVAGVPEGGYFMATLPERGEYANATRFITSEKHSQSPQVSVYDNLDCRRLAMFSDGIQNLVLDCGNAVGVKPFVPFFDRTFDWFMRQPDGLQAYTGLRRFLGSANIRQRTDDDVTLLLATR